MNKMDDYFKKNLTNYDVSEDGWNSPPEHLWDNAKPHFPKKKEKRKFFFWLFFGLAFISLLGLAFYLGQQSQSNLTDLNTENLVSNKKQNLKDLNSKEPIQNSEEITSIDNASISYDETKIINDSNKDFNLKPSKKTNNTDQNSSTDIPKQKIENTIDAKDQNFESISSSTETSTNIFNGQLNSAQKEEEEIAASIIVKNQEGDQSSAQTKKLIDNIYSLNSLNKSLSLNQRALPIITSGMVLKPKSKVMFPRQEAGFSHSLYLLDFLENAIESDNSSTDFINIEDRFQNLNLHYSKWIGDKWSISTGAHLTKMNLDLDLSVWDTLTTSEINEYINQVFDDKTVSRNRVVNDDESVNLLPGIMVNEGDLLNIKGQVNLSLTALQIPVFINRHFYKKRMEFQIGAGVSLDLLSAKQNAIELTLWRDQAQISEPFVQGEQKENAIDYSVYFKSGMRYYISKNVNAGIDLNVSVLEPIFSNVSFGLYYRWY